MKRRIARILCALALCCVMARAEDPEMTVLRERALTVFRDAYPDAIVLFSRQDAQRDAFGVWFLTETQGGTAWIRDDALVSLDCTQGAYLQDGSITWTGARKAIELYRPEAEIGEIERDEEDGFLVYEGDAYIDGIEYEFEIDIETGMLLEWEVD